MGRDPRSAHVSWILVHAFLPVLTHDFHGGDSGLSSAFVCRVLVRADGHLGQEVGNGFRGLFVDVGTDGAPETVEDVHGARDDEEIE